MQSADSVGLMIPLVNLVMNSDTYVMYEAGRLGQHQISLEEIPDLELFQLLDFLRRLELDD